MQKNNFQNKINDIHTKALNARKRTARTPKAKKPVDPAKPKNSLLPYGVYVFVLLLSLGITFLGIRYAASQDVWWYVPMMACIGFLFYLHWGVTGDGNRMVLHRLAFVLFLGAAVLFARMYQQPVFRTILSVGMVILAYIYNHVYGCDSSFSWRYLQAASVLMVGAGFMLGMDLLLPHMLSQSIWHGIWLAPLLIFAIVFATSISLDQDISLYLSLVVGVVALIKAINIVTTGAIFLDNAYLCGLIVAPLGFFMGLAGLILPGYIDRD